jgi:hypothetical protein
MNMLKNFFLGILVVCALGFLYKIATSDSASINTAITENRKSDSVSPSKPIASSDKKQDISATAQIEASAVGISNKSSVQLSVEQLSQSRSMLELLDRVRQSNDIQLQEYALNASRELCFNASLHLTTGYLPLIDSLANKLQSVLAVLQPSQQSNYNETIAKCKEFNSNKAIEAWHKEVMQTQAPISISKKTFINNAGDKAKSEAIKNILESDTSAAKIYFLRSDLTPRLVPLLSKVLPASMHGDDATLLTRIGIEVGACRAGAPCGFNTVARSKLCMWYGECGAYDVETAYRRLHQLYEVPFDYVDRLATHVEYAIKTKNASLLLGAT